MINNTNNIQLPEIWKDILGYEGHYQISNLGNVKRFTKYKSNILKPRINKRGYVQIILCKNNCAKTFRLHRIIAESFIPNPYKKLQVNHINGVRHDNKVENLEWVTQNENMKHAFENRLAVALKGESQPNSKLKEIQVLDIKERIKKRESNISIAKLYNVSMETISNIKRNRTWKHLNN